MSDIGPFDKVSFNGTSNIRNDAGEVKITAGTDAAATSELALGVGQVTLDGDLMATQDYVDNALLSVDASGVTKEYVDQGDAANANKITSLTARVATLEQGTGSGSSQQLYPGAFTNVSAFGSGWSNSAGLGAQPQAPAGYRKFGTDIELRGTVGGTGASPIIFILPSGFRPAVQVTIPVSGTEAYANVKINPNGQVLFSAPNSNATMVSLHGVRFSTLA